MTVDELDAIVHRLQAEGHGHKEIWIPHSTWGWAPSRLEIRNPHRFPEYEAPDEDMAVIS